VDASGDARSRFRLAGGVRAFSVSAPAVDAVKGYIRNQRAHHAKRGFEAEYLAVLEIGRVEFNKEHLG
jgi:putative transposase